MFSRILNTFGTKSLTAVINLLIAILLSQYLGPAGKGVQSLIITTITFILVFANLVGGATLVYLAPRHEASRLVIPSYIWTLVTGLVAYGVLWYFPVIDKAFILHATILALLNSVASIHISLLIGKEKIKTANFIGLVQPLALIISLGTCFIFFGKATVESYIQSLYISFSLSLSASIIWFIKYCGPFRFYPLSYYWDLSKEMVQFGLLNQVAHVTQMLSFRLSYYVLDHFRGEAAVGVYSNGISLAESIWLIAKSISLVQYARIANLQDRQQAAEFTVRLIKAGVVMSLIILVPLLLLPADFFVFLFGKGFEGTRMVILTLSVGVLVYNYSILIGHYFSGTGRYWVNAVTSSIGLVASIALYYSLIPLYGQIGAGLATSISYIITSVIFIIWFAKEYKTWRLMFLPTGEDLLSLRMEVKKIFDK